MTLGEKLQRLRADAGMSQEDLAERLGVSRQAISKWELDKTVPDVKYIVELSDLFRVSTDYLLKDGILSPEPAASTGAADSRRQEAFFPGQPYHPSKDNSGTVCTLLSCGNVILLALIFLHFLLLRFFYYYITLIPLFLASVLAPIFFLISRACLHAPAEHLRRFRRSGAACLTLWGLSVVTILGYSEVVEDLLFSAVEGPLSLPLFFGLTAVLVSGLYLVALLLVKYLTRTVNK